MQKVQAGVPFAVRFQAPNQNAALFLAANVYDVSNGAPVFVATIQLRNMGNGLYLTGYTLNSGKSLLIITIAYSDAGYTEVWGGTGPLVEVYQDNSTANTLMPFFYGAYDQNAFLNVTGNVFDNTVNPPVAIKAVTMSLVAFGVYFGSYNGQIGKNYLVSEVPSDMARPRGQDIFQLAQPYAFGPPSMSDVVDTCADALATYLRQIPGLTVLTEWPYANEKLSYPSLTITTGKAKRMPQMIHVDSVSAPNNGQVVANLVTGSYDCSFQLDLWTRTKLERRQVLKQILDAFEAQSTDDTFANNPSGLSLQITSYFNEWVRFEIDTHEHMDDEAAAQRQERREKIAVLLNCREIRQRTYYAINTLAVELLVTQENVDLTDDSTDTDTYVLPAE